MTAVSAGESSPYGVHPRPALTSWTLHLSTVPVAITAVHPTWPNDDADFLHNLAGSFGFGFRQVDAVWRSCHTDAEVAGYVIELRARSAQSSDTGPLTVEHLQVVPGVRGQRIARVVISVACQTLVRETDRDISAGRAAMADVVGSLLRQAGNSSSAVIQITDAWLAAPPTLALHIQNHSDDAQRPACTDPPGRGAGIRDRPAGRTGCAERRGTACYLPWRGCEGSGS